MTHSEHQFPNINLQQAKTLWSPSMKYLWRVLASKETVKSKGGTSELSLGRLVRIIHVRSACCGHQWQPCGTQSAIHQHQPMSWVRENILSFIWCFVLIHIDSKYMYNAKHIYVLHCTWTMCKDIYTSLNLQNVEHTYVYTDIYIYIYMSLIWCGYFYIYTLYIRGREPVIPAVLLLSGRRIWPAPPKSRRRASFWTLDTPED